MKVAVCFTPNQSDCMRVITRMAQAQTLDGRQTHQVFEVGSGALAAVRAAERFSAVPLCRQGPQGNLLLISGVPITLHGALEQQLRTVTARDYQAAARSLSALDGAFAAVFWDNLQQKLLIVTDSLGMQPLYALCRQGLFLLATELKGLGASGLVDIELEPAGWGAFLSFGHFIGEHTSLRGARRVAPGSVLVYDPADGSLVTSRYWQWPAPKPSTTLAEVDTGALVEVLRHNMQSYLAHTQHSTLLLSGGFDSRLLLALLKQSGVSPKALIVQHRDENANADGRFAVRVARRLHTDYEVVTPPSSYYSSGAYLEYLLMNEVATPSLYLFIAQVAAYLRPDMQAVWEGVFPGFALAPQHQSPGGFAAYLQQECKFWQSRPWRAAARVFARPLAEHMYEAFLQGLEREKAQYPDDSFGVSQFIARNHARNRTAPNPLQVYANTVLPFTPGLSKDFWGLIAPIPFEVKADFKLYLELYKRHFPHAMAVPYCSGRELVAGKGMAPGDYLAAAWSGVGKNRLVAGALRRMRLGFRWQPSELVTRALAQVDPGHPDLNASAVRHLQRAPDSPDPQDRAARELLFYWHVWRGVMGGDLNLKEHDSLRRMCGRGTGLSVSV